MRLSSRLTRPYKIISVATWVGVILYAYYTVFARGHPNQNFSRIFGKLTVITLLGVSGLARSRYYDLYWLDEVYEEGDYLIFKRGARREKVALNQISKVLDHSYIHFFGFRLNFPFELITLKLRQDTSFGDLVTFAAPLTKYSIKGNKVISYLRERIEE